MTTIRVNKVVEKTSNAGVTVDGCLMKDTLLHNKLSWQMSTTSTQALTSGANNLISFSTVDWDTYGGIASTANNRVTIPVTGKYLVRMNTSFDDSSRTIRISFFVNGALVKEGTNSSALTVRSWGGMHTVLNLTSGDLLQVYIYTTTAGVVVGQSGVEKSRFNGCWVGK